MTMRGRVVNLAFFCEPQVMFPHLNNSEEAGETLKCAKLSDSLPTCNQYHKSVEVSYVGIQRES